MGTLVILTFVGKGPTLPEAKAREAVELFLLQSLRRGRKELAKPVLEQVQQAGARGVGEG